MSSKKRSARQPRCAVISGTNGTGKSTWIKNLLEKTKDQRVLIVTDGGAPEIWQNLPLVDVAQKEDLKAMNTWQHTYASRYKKNAVFHHIIENFRNGTVIFDDCRPYIDDNIRQCGRLSSLLTDRRHLGLDIFFIVHAIDQIPPDIYAYSNYLVMGASPRVIDRNRLKKYLEPGTISTLERYQAEIHREFTAAEARADGSQYGLFKVIKL